eukprot:scaffold5849_cov101-Isochrysis_galbana.AAC.1
MKCGRPRPALHSQQGRMLAGAAEGSLPRREPAPWRCVRGGAAWMPMPGLRRLRPPPSAAGSVGRAGQACRRVPCEKARLRCGRGQVRGVWRRSCRERLAPGLLCRRS